MIVKIYSKQRKRLLAYGTVDGKAADKFIRSLLHRDEVAVCEDNGVRWEWALRLNKKAVA